MNKDVLKHIPKSLKVFVIGLYSLYQVVLEQTRYM